MAGVILAIYGLYQQAKKGRPDPSPVTVAMATSPPVKSADIELVVNALSMVASATMRANLLTEYQIYKATLDEGADLIPFGEWEDKREIAEAAAMLRAQKAQPRS